MSELLHATAVLIDDVVLLLAGRSGAGKSDLALRLIDRGARLVSDDYTAIELRDGRVHASAPPAIAGRLEVRGIGIVDVGESREGPVALMLDLDGEPMRLPAEEPAGTMLCGVSVPTLALAALEPSAALKAEWALRLYGRPQG